MTQHSHTYYVAAARASARLARFTALLRLTVGIAAGILPFALLASLFYLRGGLQP